MEIGLLTDYPQNTKQIAGWYYNEWAHISPGITEAMVYKRVLAFSNNRTSIPLMLIISDNDELVGVAQLKYRENKHYPEYEHWLGGVFVKPSRRGEGISNLLISEAMVKAKNIGVPRLYLQCESHNVGLYKRHGFQILHQARHHQISTTIMDWNIHS